MSGIAKDWLFVFAVIGLLAVAIGIEIAWLVRSGWTSAGRAAVFVILSDLLGFFAGLTISFLVIAIMMGLAWDGSLGSVPGGAVTQWTALIFALACPGLLLFLLKRGLLAGLSIRSGVAAWKYSAAATALVFAVALGLPLLIFFLI